MVDRDDGQVVHAYVDAIGGLDSRSGETPGNALKTRVEWRRKFAARLFGRDTELVTHYAGVGGFDESATGVATYEDSPSLVVTDGAETFAMSCHHRGPHMVAYGPTPQLVASATVDPVFPQKTRVVVQGSQGWSTNTFSGTYARITRGGVKVIFEQFIGRNGDNWVDLDVPVSPHVAAGDLLEIVWPGARVLGPIGYTRDQDRRTTNIVSYGARPYGLLTGNASIGHHIERLQVGPLFVSGQAVSLDRVLLLSECDFAGCWLDLIGCSAWRPSDLSIPGAVSVLLQGYTAMSHDLAGMRPDALLDPIYQGDTSQMHIGMVGGRFKVGHFNGGPAYFLAERNCSFYDSPGAGITCELPGSQFTALPPGNAGGRVVALHGEGNATYGIHARNDGRVRINRDSTWIYGAPYKDLAVDGLDCAYSEFASVWRGNFTGRLLSSMVDGYPVPWQTSACITDLAP